MRTLCGPQKEKSRRRAMPRSKSVRCSGRLTLGTRRCRSCTREGSTCTSERERKSACFWLSPSSTTRSPGRSSVSRSGTIESCRTSLPSTYGAICSRRCRFSSRREFQRRCERCLGDDGSMVRAGDHAAPGSGDASCPGCGCAWRRCRRLDRVSAVYTPRTREIAVPESAREREHTMACVRILIADDHELVREGLRALLASRPAWEVCGEAADGVEAIEKAAELQPDVVLLDVSMPRLNGLEAAALIRRESPASEIVIVSQHDPAEMLPSALEAGARGYVSKSEVGSNLLSLIESMVQPASPRANENGAATRVAPGAPAEGDECRSALERSQVEEMLRQRSAQFETLVDQAPIGVFLLDGELRIRQVNPVARPSFGPFLDLVGRDYCEVLRAIRTPEYAAKVLRIFRHTLATGESHQAIEPAPPRDDSS